MKLDQRITGLVQKVLPSRRLGQWLKRGWQVFAKYSNLSKPEAWLNTFTSLILRLGAILLLLGFVIFLWRMLNYRGYTIEQFNVPKALQESGFDGTVIARKLEDKYLAIKSLAVSIKEDSIQAVGDEQQPEFNVDVLGVGLSLRSIGFHLRDLFGRKNNFIRGELTLADEAVGLTLRMSGALPETIVEPLEHGTRQAVDQLLGKAAELILKNTDPYRLSLYYNQIKAYEKGIETAQRMLMDRPSEEHWAYLAWGANLESRQFLEEAMEKYELSILTKPDFALGWLRKGYVLRMLDRNEDSVPFFKEAITLNPEEPNYWNAYAHALFFTGQHEAADDAFQRADELDEKETAWLINWADTKVSRGEFETAHGLLDKAIEKARKHQNYFELNAVQLFKAMLDQDSAAMVNYARIVWSLGAKDKSNLSFITTAFFRSKNYREAIQAGRQSLNYDNNAEQRQRIFNLVAMSYNFIGLPDSGLVFAQEAIAVDTSVGYPYSTLAETYHYLGDRSGFLEQLQTALDKGLSPGVLKEEDQPYQKYWADPEFQELLEKYRTNN